MFETQKGQRMHRASHCFPFKNTNLSRNRVPQQEKQQAGVTTQAFTNNKLRTNVSEIEKLQHFDCKGEKKICDGSMSSCLHGAIKTEIFG